MTQIALTDIGIQKLKSDKQTIFYDTNLAGFGVRVPDL